MAPGNAFIQWLGYDAPDSIGGSQVPSAADANEGAPRLVADVNGYRAAAEQAGNQQHVTVIGHSYGSVVVGKAGLADLAADDVIFIGSPGVGASHVDQLSAGIGHVWAGSTRHDPVVQLTQGSWFTEDSSRRGPYDSSFGAKQFGAVDDSVIHDSHTRYYDRGSESLRNIGNIATGNYNRVTEQCWSDNPLTPEPLSDIPIAGTLIANPVKGTIQFGTDLADGIGQTFTDISEGNLGKAAASAAEAVSDAAVNVISNAGDLINEAVGTVVETGLSIAEGAEWLADNTIGVLFSSMFVDSRSRPARD